MRKSRAKLTQDYERDPTVVECPSCGAWVGWACGDGHCEGYHRSRIKAAKEVGKVILIRTRFERVLTQRVMRSA